MLILLDLALFVIWNNMLSYKHRAKKVRFLFLWFNQQINGMLQF